MFSHTICGSRPQNLAYTTAQDVKYHKDPFMGRAQTPGSGQHRHVLPRQQAGCYRERLVRTGTRMEEMYQKQYNDVSDRNPTDQIFWSFGILLSTRPRWESSQHELLCRRRLGVIKRQQVFNVAHVLSVLARVHLSKFECWAFACFTLRGHPRQRSSLLLLLSQP